MRHDSDILLSHLPARVSRERVLGLIVEDIDLAYQTDQVAQNRLGCDGEHHKQHDAPHGHSGNSEQIPQEYQTEDHPGNTYPDEDVLVG